MKSYDLLPTRENLLEAVKENVIGRNEDVVRFAELLNSIENNFSIALSGGWGSGKTFFVKQVKMLLESINEKLKTSEESDKDSDIGTMLELIKEKEISFIPQLCIYYDAWENDSDDDPIFSIILSIMDQVDEEFSLLPSSNLVKIVCEIFQNTTGKKCDSLLDGFRGEDVLKALKKNKKVETEIKEFLDTIFKERGDRMVIFIDELDRCNPNFAVKLLERVKHYFSNDRITFVFSINDVELQHTIKQHYGSEFDACRYLDRFFDLRLSLPPADIERFSASMNVSKYSSTCDLVCNSVIMKYSFTLREMKKYYFMSHIAIHTVIEGEVNRNQSYINPAIWFGMEFVVPIMIGLKFICQKLYDEFVDGQQPDLMYEILKNIPQIHFNILRSSEETYSMFNSIYDGEVTVEQKLMDAYGAIFNTNYNEDLSEVKVGHCYFTPEVKKQIFRTMSLLSQYSRFDISL